MMSKIFDYIRDYIMNIKKLETDIGGVFEDIDTEDNINQNDSMSNSLPNQHHLHIIYGKRADGSLIIPDFYRLEFSKGANTCEIPVVDRLSRDLGRDLYDRYKAYGDIYIITLKYRIVNNRRIVIARITYRDDQSAIDMIRENHLASIVINSPERVYGKGDTDVVVYDYRFEISNNGPRRSIWVANVKDFSITKNPRHLATRTFGIPTRVQFTTFEYKHDLTAAVMLRMFKSAKAECGYVDEVCENI